MTGRIVDSREVSERFLWDLRRTAQELVIEQHAEHLKELGRRHGFGLSIEPYDMNPVGDLTLGAVADVPMGEFWSQGFVFQSAVQLHRSGIDRPHERSTDRGRRGVYGRCSRGLEVLSGTHEGSGRLGVLHGRQSPRVSSLCTPAVARPPTRHDHGTLRRALGTHADLVAHGPGVSPVSGALPVHAAAGTSRGRHLLLGARRCAARVSRPAVGARGPVRRPTRLQLRRLCPEVLLAIGHGRARPRRVSRRIVLPSAGAAGLRHDDPCPAAPASRNWWQPGPRSWEVHPIVRPA